LSAGAVIMLFFSDRISGAVMAPFLVDIVLGGLFIASYVSLARYPAAWPRE